MLIIASSSIVGGNIWRTSGWLREYISGRFIGTLSAGLLVATGASQHGLTSANVLNPIVVITAKYSCEPTRQEFSKINSCVSGELPHSANDNNQEF